MARQAILKAQKFPKQNFAVLGKLGKVHTGLRAAKPGRQRNHQHVRKLVTLRIPRPRVRNRTQNRQQ